MVLISAPKPVNFTPPPSNTGTFRAVIWLNYSRTKMDVCNREVSPPPNFCGSDHFLDFFENRRNYAISMVHNVFQGHLEVAEHVFDIIFMFHHVFDSVWREKWARVVKMAHFRPFGACRAVWGQDPHFGVNFQSCSKCPKMVSKVFTSIYWTQRKYF